MCSRKLFRSAERLIYEAVKKGYILTRKKVFEDFIDAHLNEAFRLALSYTRHYQDAEDVVSQSVERALRSLNGLRSPEYMKTWFFRIIINTSLTVIKQRRREAADETLLTEVSDNEALRSNIEFYAMLDSLEPQYREVIILRFLQDLKLAEIAEITGRNQNTVKTMLYTALKRLKTEMEAELRD